VGAGRGSIARWLADAVGPTGSVVAADIDPRFLTGLPKNVAVRRLDIRVEDVEAGAYDLVHCRALLMHLPDPAEVLAHLAGALRPGGVLLAEEGDYGLYHYGGHPDAQALTDEAHRALDALSDAGIFNARFGRGLPAMLTECGLALGGSEVDTRVSRPNEPQFEFARASALDSLARLIAAGVIDGAETDRLERFFGHLGSIVTGPSLVAAWGQKHA